MISLRPLVWAVLAVFVAAIAQGRLSHALHICWAQPDFPLLTLACAGVLLGGNQATFLGLWTGLLTAAMIPGTFGTLLTSRVLSGTLAGYLSRFVIRDSVLVPPLVTLLVTGTAEVVRVLMAPGLSLHPIHLWLEKVGGEMLYNALLSLPVYFLLRRLGLGVVQPDSFGSHY